MSDNSTCICDIDYCCSEAFWFGFDPVERKPLLTLNDTDVENPRILETLEAMGLITLSNKPKLKGVQL